MYKIGNVSGLCDKTCDETKHTIDTVGDIVPKLAKKCCDVPKKMRAPSKVIEVTDGCFSSAQVISVCDELGGGGDSDSADADAAAADGACDGAASTGGGCGGGKSSKSCDQDASKSSCNKGGGGCGGKSSQASKTSKCTGQKLVDMKVPSVDDIAKSKTSDVIKQERDDETAFRHAYCELKPYPECATCPYASKAIKTTDVDVASLFKQIDEACQQLTKGNYALADNLFTCPGQLAALMQSDLGPIAAVAGPEAVKALVELVALRGAVASYRNLAIATAGTDFRREVMYAADKLLKAGSMVGLPGVFARELSGILSDVGCSAKDLTRLRARSGSSRETRYGDDYSLWGSLGTGRTQVTTPVYRSDSRKTPSKKSVTKADKTLASCRVFLSGARSMEDDPLSAAKLGKNLATALKKNYAAADDEYAEAGKSYYKKDPVTGEFIKLDVKPGDNISTLNAKYGPLFIQVEVGVSSAAPAKVPAKETSIQEGRMYYYTDPKTGKQVQLDGAVKGDSLAKTKLELARKLGIVSSYVDGSAIDVVHMSEEAVSAFIDGLDAGTKNKLNNLTLSYKPLALSTDAVSTVKTFTPVTSEIVPGTENQYFTVQNGKYIRASSTRSLSAGESGVQYFSADDQILPSKSILTYEVTEDTVPEEGKKYFAINVAGDYEEINTTDIETFASLTYVVYERSLSSAADPGYAKRYTGSDPLVLENGLVVSEPVFIDAGSMEFAIDTTSLITKTLVNAGEMASIESLGLTPYEVTMSYIVDHARNGSVLPFDIRAEEISTALEYVSDDD